MRGKMIEPATTDAPGIQWTVSSCQIFYWNSNFLCRDSRLYSSRISTEEYSSIVSTEEELLLRTSQVICHSVTLQNIKSLLGISVLPSIQETKQWERINKQYKKEKKPLWVISINLFLPIKKQHYLASQWLKFQAVLLVGSCAAFGKSFTSSMCKS